MGPNTFKDANIYFLPAYLRKPPLFCRGGDLHWNQHCPCTGWAGSRLRALVRTIPLGWIIRSPEVTVSIYTSPKCLLLQPPPFLSPPCQSIHHFLPFLECIFLEAPPAWWLRGSAMPCGGCTGTSCVLQWQPTSPAAHRKGSNTELNCFIHHIRKERTWKEIKTF